jgi:protein-tyrosine phosphatase
MPFGPYDNVDIWQSYLEQDINLVIVLVEPQEFLVYARRDLPKFYRSHNLEVLHLPIPDLGVPDDMSSWKNGLNIASRAAADGKNVVVHCLAGIGRTGIFLACLAKENLNINGEDAIDWVRKSITGAVENSNQEQFVINYQLNKSE